MSIDFEKGTLSPVRRTTASCRFNDHSPRMVQSLLIRSRCLRGVCRHVASQMPQISSVSPVSLMSSHNLRIRRNFLVDREFIRPKNQCCSDETPPDSPPRDFSWPLPSLGCTVSRVVTWDHTNCVLKHEPQKSRSRPGCRRLCRAARMAHARGLSSATVGC